MCRFYGTDKTQKPCGSAYSQPESRDLSCFRPYIPQDNHAVTLTCRRHIQPCPVLQGHGAVLVTVHYIIIMALSRGLDKDMNCAEGSDRCVSLSGMVKVRDRELCLQPGNSWMLFLLRAEA